MGALTTYTGDTLVRARRWVDAPADERRRRATIAANARDRAELVELTVTYATLYGRSGATISRHTIEAYGVAIGHLLAGWQHVNLLHPTRDDAAVLVRTWESTGAKPSTVSLRLAGCRALYRALRWAIDSGTDKRASVPDPFADVRAAPDPTPAWEKRRPYDDADVERILATIDRQTQPDARLLVLLCAHGGLRISEALSLTTANVDLAGRTMTVIGKGRKQRTLDLGRSLLEELEQAEVYPDGRYMHWHTPQGARKAVKSICAAAGVDYRTVHAFRHSCGTRLYQQTGKLEIVQRRLGHSDISTTQIYAKMGDRRVRDAVSDW